MAGDDNILVEEVDEETEVDGDEDAADGGAVKDEIEFEADSDDDEFSDDDDDENDEKSDKPAEDEPVALDELEAEELEIVETDTTETMLVDEASEIRAIRREELTMDVESGGQQSDEFVCQSCFLVLKATQLANKRKQLCVDCV